MEGYRNVVDVFSVGAVVYALLCGYEPFFGETDKDLVLANSEAVVEFHLGSPWIQVPRL
jgi:calcium/calmodulin-dependent protein kinase I